MIKELGIGKFLSLPQPSALEKRKKLLLCAGFFHGIASPAEQLHVYDIASAVLRLLHDMVYGQISEREQYQAAATCSHLPYLECLCERQLGSAPRSIRRKVPSAINVTRNLIFFCNPDVTGWTTKG